MANAPRLVIVGKPTCPLCGRALTQRDADKGLLFGIGSDPARFDALFCIDHFYVRKDGKLVKTEDYEVNMQLLALGLKEGRQL